MFETVEGNSLQARSCQVNVSKIPKKISVYAAPENEFMWGMKIEDANNQLICYENWFDYNPNQNWADSGIPNNKRIVGLYGDMDDSVITGLGLLLSDG